MEWKVVDCQGYNNTIMLTTFANYTCKWKVPTPEERSITTKKQSDQKQRRG